MADFQVNPGAVSRADAGAGIGGFEIRTGVDRAEWREDCRLERPARMTDLAEDPNISGIKSVVNREGEHFLLITRSAGGGGDVLRVYALDRRCAA